MSEYEEFIKCPYCGYEEQDSWEYQGDSGEIECPECYKEFFYERILTVDYRTIEIKRDNEYEN